MRQQSSDHAASFRAALCSRRAVSRLGLCVAAVGYVHSARGNLSPQVAPTALASTVRSCSGRRESLPRLRKKKYRVSGVTLAAKMVHSRDDEQMRVNTNAGARSRFGQCLPSHATGATSMSFRKRPSLFGSAPSKLVANPSIEGTCNIWLRQLSPAPHVKR